MLTLGLNEPEKPYRVTLTLTRLC
uniref:Uncharacterized protein n=1 Tax=Anguilla anguilla TaxID=7936 RepID=A0A0E9VSV5_ANGAN